jgi:hypothetical protein
LEIRSLLEDKGEIRCWAAEAPLLPGQLLETPGATMAAAHQGRRWEHRSRQLPAPPVDRA